MVIWEKGVSGREIQSLKMTFETRLEGFYWLNVPENSRAKSGFSHGLIKGLGKHILFLLFLFSLSVGFILRLAFCGWRIATVSPVLTFLYLISMFGKVKTFVSAKISFCLLCSEWVTVHFWTNYYDQSKCCVLTALCCVTRYTGMV